MAILEIKQDKKQEKIWIRYIKNRILKKKNFLCLVWGPTGSGKSYTCLSVALDLDKNFSIDKVVFGLKGLMNLINSGEDFPPGTVFLWDEFQIDASNRNWQSLTNKLLNSLLSTFRHKNFILLINAPYGDFIDSQSRKLMHAEFEVKGINFDTEQTKIKPMCLQYNGQKGKFYRKYLRVKNSKGVCPVKTWRINKPPLWLTEPYEKMKTDFTSNLNKSIGRQLDKLDKYDKPSDKKEPLTPKQQEIIDLMEKYQDANKVAKEIGMGVRSVYFHLAQAKKKGYNLKKEGEISGE